MKISDDNIIAKPRVKSRGKFDWDKMAILRIRQIIIENNKNKKIIPKFPISSDMAAKIKSVCGSGKKPYWV